MLESALKRCEIDYISLILEDALASRNSSPTLLPAFTCHSPTLYQDQARHSVVSRYAISFQLPHLQSQGGYISHGTRQAIAFNSNVSFIVSNARRLLISLQIRTVQSQCNLGMTPNQITPAKCSPIYRTSIIQMPINLAKEPNIIDPRPSKSCREQHPYRQQPRRERRFSSQRSCPYRW